MKKIIINFMRKRNGKIKVIKPCKKNHVRNLCARNHVCETAGKKLFMINDIKGKILGSFLT